jgi:serine/threonine protein kinase
MIQEILAKLEESGFTEVEDIADAEDFTEEVLGSFGLPAKAIKKLDAALRLLGNTNFSMKHQGSNQKPNADVATNADAAGNRMTGRYIVTEVGKRVSSGTSDLVEGRHEVTGAVVRTKVTRDSDELQREKRALTTTKSENVVKLVDCVEGFDGDGSHAIMMESGMGNMAELVEAMKQTGFHDDMNKKAMGAKDAVLALQAIHDNHFVWSDLKSENFVSYIHFVCDLVP